MTNYKTAPEDVVPIGQKLAFGAGHLAILKQQLETTPEYELVKFGDLGNPDSADR